MPAEKELNSAGPAATSDDAETFLSDMDAPITFLLKAGLWSYVSGALAGLLCWRRERLANLFAFGAATIAGLCGTLGAGLFLGNRGRSELVQFDLLPQLIPYLPFTIRLDPLGAFFVLFASIVGLGLSVYSFGYVRGFYGRKNVGVLGALYNALLLATTLVFVADNAFLFLIAWEFMALTAFCLVSFEHEKREARDAGVLFFIMSHIGTGCLLLGFLLLFRTT